MKSKLKKKKIKIIKVDVDKCIGCRACELFCSAFHAAPKYSNINPAKARMRMIIDELKDIYVPVYAGEYTAAECMGRNKYVVNGTEYEECTFCRASCPSRDAFKEPDSGLPFKCDLCADDPSQEEPVCVQACLAGALTYKEREEEEESEAQEKSDELETGLKSLADKYGLQKLVDTFVRMAQKS